MMHPEKEVGGGSQEIEEKCRPWDYVSHVLNNAFVLK